jgi:transcriptional regulator with XRE-family HTH domain
VLAKTSQAKRLPINERIRWARKRKGLSLDRLAEQVGSSRRHLIRLEKGENRPGPELRARIAVATGQPADFLMDGDDDEEEAALARELIALIRRVVSESAVVTA